jgi:superfamily II DNA or RNA helicase
MRRELYPHQTRAIEMLRHSLGTGHKRPLLQAPTGFGKTLVAAAIIDSAVRKGRRVIVTVPALPLVEQTLEAFWNEGIHDIGVMQARHHLTDGSRAVQVASIQTLERRAIPPADLVIVDEAHRTFEFLKSWMGDPDWQGVPFVGLSATPWAKGLGRDFDDLVIVTTTAELIASGYLSRFRVYAPSHPDLSGVRTVGGDYETGQLADAMNKPNLVADVVETWLRRGEGRPTLCFAVDRAHANSLQKRFEAAGVPAGYVDAYTEDADRRQIARDFASGAIKVVCNVGVLTTGVDWDVRCIILARPTKSEMLFVQIVGRGLRIAPGKDDCLILDHSDTHSRLGFVTDIAHDRLDDGTPRPPAQPRDKEALPKECPKCSYLRPPKVHVCPSCGFKPERQSRVAVDDGELVEFRPKASKPKATMAEKQRWLSGLIWLARSKGYQEGWAANKYRERFGAWPKGLGKAGAPPGDDIVSWVKSRQIAFAKRRAA